MVDRNSTSKNTSHIKVFSEIQCMYERRLYMKLLYSVLLSCIILWVHPCFPILNIKQPASPHHPPCPRTSPVSPWFLSSCICQALRQSFLVQRGEVHSFMIRTSQIKAGPISCNKKVEQGFCKRNIWFFQKVRLFVFLETKFVFFLNFASRSASSLIA